MKRGNADCPWLQRPIKKGPRSPLFLALLLIILVPSIFGQVPQANESQVKAAFLYNFGKFVKWPNPPTENTFTVCILGQDTSFGTVLESTVAGESIEGKPINVRRVGNAEEAASCRILYISSSEKNRLSAILAALNRHPVLTVSDIPKFVDRGGMIQFLLQDNRVRFAINLAPAASAGIAMSSELLKVAVIVKSGQKGED
jgi:hypothetical protein